MSHAPEFRLLKVLTRARAGQQLRARGFTLIELMIALAISLLVILAAVAALISAQRGYASVDATSQLRDNAQFASALINRQALQAGYQDLTSTTITRAETVRFGINPTPEPDIYGYNNAVISSVVGLPGGLSNDSRSGGCTDTTTACVNGSDVLVIRYYGSSEVSPGVADGSMINCSGAAETAPVLQTLTDRAYSIFYVDISSGEPTLMCAYRTSGGAFQSTPLVAGVESFQVLYSMAVAPASSGLHAHAWLRADQLGTNFNNWESVTRLRIGLLLRGPANTAVDKSATAKTWYPLGSTLASAADAGTELVTPADGRLRRTVSFTVFLRNPLGNCLPPSSSPSASPSTCN